MSTGQISVSFESVLYKDQYLVMNKHQNHVYLASPHNFNEKFEIVTFKYSAHVALKDDRGCFIGFDQTGKLVPPCTLTSKHPHTRLFLKMSKS